jgi:RNA polymerase sigma-70 factor (ECF subfamily)
MSSALDDVPGATEGLRVVNAPATYIELVSTTGARDLAVLVYRSADVDETAFALLAPTTARVYGLAVRIASSLTRMEDVAGDSSHEVWRTSTRFDADRSSAIAWIMAIAHRRAVDRLRTARDTTCPPPATPLRALGRRARRNAHQDRHSRNDLATHAEVAQVREVLALLDPAQREALELVYFDTSDRTDDLATIMSTIVTTRLADDPDGPETPEHQVPPEGPPDRAASRAALTITPGPRAARAGWSDGDR